MRERRIGAAGAQGWGRLELRDAEAPGWGRWRAGMGRTIRGAAAAAGGGRAEPGELPEAHLTRGGGWRRGTRWHRVSHPGKRLFPSRRGRKDGGGGQRWVERGQRQLKKKIITIMMLKATRVQRPLRSRERWLRGGPGVSSAPLRLRAALWAGAEPAFPPRPSACLFCHISTYSRQRERHCPPPRRVFRGRGAFPPALPKKKNKN